jgi:hypothetical protein
MKIPRWFKLSLFAFAVLGLGIQFVPVSRTNPPVVKELTWDSPKTRAYAQRACFDCHSNETKWPWYAYVAPISWMIAKDVKEARESFNFSEITPLDRVDILTDRIESGEMPLPRYLAIHAEARLSATEKQEYVAGLQRSFELSRSPK